VPFPRSRWYVATQPSPFNRADGHRAALRFTQLTSPPLQGRRECASRWYFDEGQDIVRVSRWLGHASVEMTQRYLALPADAAQGVDMARQLGHVQQKKQA
jgi:integrase